MPIPPVPVVTLTPVAYFPETYFLENLAVRADGSVLVTAVLQKELWWVPGPEPRAQVPPVLVHSFEHMVSGIVEVEADVFVICLCDGYTTHESQHRAQQFVHRFATSGEINAQGVIFDNSISQSDCGV